LPKDFTARVLGVMGLISTGFLLFTLFTSNPFLRRIPPPANGADLNPLLQDPGLIIHPPLLYVGYVGFSVAFSFAIAGLLTGSLNSAWARWARPWTMLAWSFLTMGIALGSWWAYYELGWGGWWFWDPVENASFMPWLIGTALIHSLAATEKRDVFKSWTVLLAIGAFSLSLLGTFLVRSGVLTSVHAFATDPARGVFILIFLSLVVGGALILYARRAPNLSGTNEYSFASRESFLLINSILLTITTATILLGTLYPLVLDALDLGKISVGPPYFNSVFLPLMAPLLLLVAVGQLARWKRDTLTRIGKLLLPAAGVSALVIIGIWSILGHAKSLQIALGVGLAGWVVLSTMLSILKRLALRTNLAKKLSSLSPAFLGQSLAHIGFAVTTIGITMVSTLEKSEHLKMQPGDSVSVSGFEFHFTEVRDIKGPNFEGTQGQFDIYDSNSKVSSVVAEKRYYPVRGVSMTEAGIDAGFIRDLYVSLGEPLENGAWSVRANVKPFVRWIWAGALLMAIGGITATLDKRFRRTQRKKI
jgi:cytochrome c-type biogenesis protein CcmF